MAKKQDLVKVQQEEDVTAERGGAGEVGTGRQSRDGLRNGQRLQALVDRREGSGGERSEQELPGRGSTSARVDRSKIARPDPELVPQAKRRRFSAKYKLDILTGIMLEDEKALRTAHIAFGNNEDMPGGRNCSCTHRDFLVKEPTFDVTFHDGSRRVLIEAGEFRI